MKKNIYLLSIASVLLLDLSGFFLNIAIPKLVYQSAAMLEIISYLKIILGFGAIITGAIVWHIAKKNDVTKIFKRLIIGYVIALTIGALAVSLLDPKASYLYIPVAFLFILIGIFNSVQIVFVWGMINRSYGYKAAVKHYIPLCLAILVASNVAFISLGYIPQLTSLDAAVLIFMVVISLLLLLAIVNYWGKRVPEDNSSAQGAKLFKKGFPWLQVAFLLAAGPAAFTIFRMANMMSMPMTDMMESFGQNDLYFMLLSILVWFGFSYWALNKKSWKFTLIAGAGVTLACAVAVSLYIMIMKHPEMWEITFVRSTLIDSKTLLFFPLLQMLYLYIPGKDRFRFKTGTELIGLPLMVFALSSISLLYEMYLAATVLGSPLFLQATAVIILVLGVLVARDLAKIKF